MLRLTLWVFDLTRRSAKKKENTLLLLGDGMSLLPLEQRGSKPPNGEPPVSERMYLDSNLRRWFARNLGLWRSRRQYLFDNEEVFFLDMMIRVDTNLTMKVVQDFANQRNTPEFQRLKDMSSRRQAFLQTQQGSPAAAPAKAKGDQTMARMAAKAIADRNQ